MIIPHNVTAYQPLTETCTHSSGLTTETNLLHLYDLKLPQQLSLIMSSQAISRNCWLEITDVSGAISVCIATLIMGTEMVPEMLITFKQLPWQLVKKGFVNLLQTLQSFIVECSYVQSDHKKGRKNSIILQFLDMQPTFCK
jgi:hypothetical protein